MTFTSWNNCKVGDIIISLAKKGVYRDIGDIFKILSIDGNCMYYKGVHSPDPEQWRPATPYEIAAYEQGITNINQIPKEPSYDIY
jgi:hypothetical protein